jgi:hypothetical protein
LETVVKTTEALNTGRIKGYEAVRPQNLTSNGGSFHLDNAEAGFRLVFNQET